MAKDAFNNSLEKASEQEKVEYDLWSQEFDDGMEMARKDLQYLEWLATQENQPDCEGARKKLRFNKVWDKWAEDQYGSIKGALFAIRKLGDLPPPYS